MLGREKEAWGTWVYMSGGPPVEEEFAIIRDTSGQNQKVGGAERTSHHSEPLMMEH